MIDLRPDLLNVVQKILAKCVPHAEVRAFGSRVTGTAKGHSDLDLAIVDDKKLDSKTLINLKIAFEESNLPIRVDVVDWHAIHHEFRELIQKKYEVVKIS